MTKGFGMTLDFTCQACDASFEIDLTDLLEEPRIQCPGCDVRAPRQATDNLVSALDDLFTELGGLQRKFTVTFAVESEELPPPYDRAGRRRAAPDEDDEDEADDGELPGDEGREPDE
jgi:hypothetical protein